MFSALALGLYTAAWILLIRSVKRRQTLKSRLVLGLVAVALLCHGVSAYQQIVVPEGYRLTFFNMGSLFFWVINFLVLVSSLKKPLHNLFLLLLPLTVIILVSSLPQPGDITPRHQITPGVAIHIALSVVAYSAMTMAAFQALLLAFQNYQLRHKHPTGFVRLLPPLQTMESLLFQLLWTGQILLTLAILSGAIYIDDLFAQHLAHKTVFSLLAWCVYAGLLWGHYQWGWRGNAAIRWTLVGFAPLALAYFGSKLVLELILSR
jgi:ABC-type uncharacterized transport system permease subunit